MPEPGSVEGQGSQAPKTTAEPFPRKTGDFKGYAEAAQSVGSVVNPPQSEDTQLGAEDWLNPTGRFRTGQTKEPFARQKESDLPSFAEANDRLTEILHTPTEQLTREFGEVSENVDRQAGAVNLVKGFIEWAKTTKDNAVTKMLTGNVASIVRGLARNPGRVSETVAALTEEEMQDLTKKAEGAGIIRAERKIPDAKTTPPPSAQTQTPTT